VNNQVRYSGLVFTRPGVKNLIVEVKRPGALAWNERSAEQSIDAHCIQNWKIWRDVRSVSMASTVANIRRSDFPLERSKMLYRDCRPGRDSVSEYSTSCIDIRADELLTSAK